MTERKGKTKVTMTAYVNDTAADIANMLRCNVSNRWSRRVGCR